MSKTSLIQKLKEALGEHAVLCHDAAQPDRLNPYLIDWRRRYQGKALAVIRPSDTQGVATAIRLSAKHGVSIVPQGGNTSLVGGSVPNESGTQLVLSLTRMNRVLCIDPENLSMTVQAGCLLADVQAAAERAGLLFPLSLASEGSCTIGGNLATNAGGTQVLRYGTARELCLGIEGVNAHGDIWDGLKSLRKDNTGYDLRGLLVGSEGTLGIITAASLRLFPRPRSVQAALVTCDTLDNALALLARAREQLDAQLTGFEVMHRTPLELLTKHLPEQARALKSLHESNQLPEWTVLIDAASSQSSQSLDSQVEQLLGEALANELVQAACVAQNQSQYQAMWAVREGIPLAEKAEGLMVKHDIAVPSSQVPRFVEQTSKALAQRFPGTQVVCFGHLGDGNLHYNVRGPQGISDHTFLAEHERSVNTVVYDIAQSLGGTISAEHGIGRLKREELGLRQAASRTQTMQAIKLAMDPCNTLNPGTMVP
jgi:FAD/FMN-containing dehydrogenase